MKSFKSKFQFQFCYLLKPSTTLKSTKSPETQMYSPGDFHSFCELGQRESVIFERFRSKWKILFWAYGRKRYTDARCQVQEERQKVGLVEEEKNTKCQVLSPRRRRRNKKNPNVCVHKIFKIIIVCFEFPKITLLNAAIPPIVCTPKNNHLTISSWLQISQGLHNF